MAYLERTIKRWSELSKNWHNHCSYHFNIEKVTEYLSISLESLSCTLNLSIAFVHEVTSGRTFVRSYISSNNVNIKWTLEIVRKDLWKLYAELDFLELWNGIHAQDIEFQVCTLHSMRRNKMLMYINSRQIPACNYPLDADKNTKKNSLFD